MDAIRPSFTSPFASNGTPNGFPSASATLTPTSTAPPSAAGRKRSRDEAAPNLEDDYFPISLPVKEPENEEEWVYGEGMTIIKPNKGYTMEAGSQTGTWAEEKLEEEKAKEAVLAQQIADRPVLRAAKSLRLDMTATPPIMEETITNGAASAPSPERTNNFEPTVDQFTLHLGIGWSAISADPDIQAAARGWTKFIENHFPVHNANIRLQSRGLASYLVEADEGYFLFQEDLKRGQLVSKNLEKVWTNLSNPVPLFDGEAVMEAVETPRNVVETPATKMPSVATPLTNGQDATMNGANGVNGTNGTTNGVNTGFGIPLPVSPVPSQSIDTEMDLN